MLIGLAAMPTGFLWDRAARGIGVLNALVAAYLLQILGIAAPLIGDTLVGALLGALLFGGTFVGIVGLVLTMAGRYYPSHPSRMMGKMTLSYGIAQISAPALIALTVGAEGGYSRSLVSATAAMAIGSVLILRLKSIEAKRENQRCLT